MSKFLDAVGLARFKDKLESKWKLKFDQVYNKTEVDELITAKVAEIVAGAPEDFNTLKEMSDWLAEHEDSAAAMNTAIQKNADDIASANTEIAKKVDKVTGKSLISDSEITRLAGVDNYDDSAVNTQIADIYNRCGGGKNLLKLSTSPAAQMGVTVTTNPTDGTVTIKGALTGEFAYFIIGKYTFIAGVTYILIDDSFNSGISYCYLNGNNNEFTKSGTLFTPTETKSILVYYRARKSITYDNIHYPMIVEKSVVDKTFTPYVSTNKELQERIDAHEAETKSQAAVSRTTLGTQCRNLLPYRCMPHSNSCGIKVAVADDGVVTLSGTNTTSFTYNINFTTPMVFDRDVFIVGAEKLSNVVYNCKVDIKVNNSNYPNIGTVGLRIPAGTSIRYLYFQQLTSGATIDATIAPMIVYADVLDRTYEPYKPSLQEQISQLVARIEALEGSAATTEE